MSMCAELSTEGKLIGNQSKVIHIQKGLWRCVVVSVMMWTLHMLRNSFVDKREDEKGNFHIKPTSSA